MPDWALNVLGILLGVAGGSLLVWALFWDRARGRRRCPRCWYSMEGTLGKKCPECGREARSDRALVRTRRRGGWAALGVVLLLAGLFGPRAQDALKHGWQRLVPTTAIVGLGLVPERRWVACYVHGSFLPPTGRLLVDFMTRCQDGEVTRWQAALWSHRLERTYTRTGEWGITQEERDLLARLSSAPLPPRTFENARLADVFAYAAEAAGAELEIDWDGLARGGRLSESTPIDLHVRAGWTPSDVITVLSRVPGGVSGDVRGGTLVICSSGALQDRVAVYDVGDLIEAAAASGTPAGVGDYQEMIYFGAKSPEWGGPRGNGIPGLFKTVGIETIGDRIVVSSPAALHAGIEALLDQARRPVGPRDPQSHQALYLGEVRAVLAALRGGAVSGVQDIGTLAEAAEAVGAAAKVRVVVERAGMRPPELPGLAELAAPSGPASALDVLDALEGADEISWTIRDGTVVIGNAWTASEGVVLVYDVADLAPMYSGEFEGLAAEIAETVKPYVSWTDHGGSSSARPYGGLLVVDAPPRVQASIWELLARRRAGESAPAPWSEGGWRR